MSSTNQHQATGYDIIVGIQDANRKFLEVVQGDCKKYSFVYLKNILNLLYGVDSWELCGHLLLYISLCIYMTIKCN